MGCGKSKSKQDVATGNTVVTARGNSCKNDNNSDESKRGDATVDAEILPENSTTVIEESVENVTKVDDHDHDHEKVAPAPEVKEEITESIETLDDREKPAAESTVVIDHVDDAVANKDVAAVAVEEDIVESSGNELICRTSSNAFFSSPKIHHGEASGSMVSDTSLDFESPRHEFPIAEESGMIVNENSAKEEDNVETVPLETPVAADEEKGAKVIEEIIEVTESKN